MWIEHERATWKIGSDYRLLSISITVRYCLELEIKTQIDEWWHRESPGLAFRFCSAMFYSKVVSEKEKHFVKSLNGSRMSRNQSTTIIISAANRELKWSRKWKMNSMEKSLTRYKFLGHLFFAGRRNTIHCEILNAKDNTGCHQFM